jgi:polar amino acid transport system substrate-binding protein
MERATVDIAADVHRLAGTVAVAEARREASADSSVENVNAAPFTTRRDAFVDEVREKVETMEKSIENVKASAARKTEVGLKTTVWVETARAYSARIGIPLVIVEHATPPEAIACLKGGSCDQLFLPLDARAAQVGDFSNPLFQFDYTLMVPEGSAIAKVADVDRPGIRIAAVRNHASTNELVRQIKRAEFVYSETPEQTLALMSSGKADVMASTRLVLLAFSAKLSGARVLADRYGANINRMVVPKGKADRLAFVNEFVEEAKASGAVQQFIERGGTRGVTVAPPGNAD